MADALLRSSAAPSSSCTAFTLMQEVMSEPVSLGCQLLDRLTSSSRGLKVGEATLVTGTAGAGKTELAYVVAARHAVKGGRVAWVSCPGSAGLCCRRFVAVLERVMCLHLLAAAEGANANQPELQQPLPVRFEQGVQSVGGVEAFQAMLLGMLQRVKVTACGSIGALREALSSPDAHGRLFPSQQLAALGDRTNISQSLSTASCPPLRSGPGGNGAVPLLIVDGLGAACETAVLERLVGQEAPMALWLGDATATLRCALLVTDTLPSGGGGGFGGGGGALAPEALLDQSHTFRHLRWCLQQANHHNAGGAAAGSGRGAPSAPSSQRWRPPHSSRAAAGSSLGVGPSAVVGHPQPPRRPAVEMFRTALVLAPHRDSVYDARHHAADGRRFSCCLLAISCDRPALPAALTVASASGGGGLSYAQQPYRKASGLAAAHRPQLVFEPKGFVPFCIGQDGLCFT